MLNFWASWCGPCHREAPELEAAWRVVDHRAMFVGINTLERDRSAARAFLTQYGLSYPNVKDERSALGIDYGIYSVPGTFIFDSGGVLRGRYLGPVSKELLLAALEKLE